MKVYTTDGQVHDFPYGKQDRYDPQVLTIVEDSASTFRTLASFPLVNVQRWEP